MDDADPAALPDSFANPLTATIVAFLRAIGLTVRAGTLSEPTFLPGIEIDQGALVVDEARLRFPGDLLHEAGHLAVATPDRRAQMHKDAGADGGEEIMAIAWSYAAAVHLQLDLVVLFHSDGYRGEAAWLIDNFTNGSYIGLPGLQWAGLTLDTRHALEQGLPPYPYMLRWLREA